MSERIENKQKIFSFFIERVECRLDFCKVRIGQLNKEIEESRDICSKLENARQSVKAAMAIIRSYNQDFINIESIKKKVEENIRLNFDEEKFLGRLIKEEKNEEAREFLILGNLYLAAFIAKQMATNMPFDDILQCARVGLIDAVDKYDYRKELRFVTYAEFRIRGAIKDAIRDTNKLSRSFFEKIQKISEIIISLVEKTGCEPTEDELIAATGYKIEFIKDVQNFLNDDFFVKDIKEIDFESNEEILDIANSSNYTDGETKILLKEKFFEKSEMINNMLHILPKRRGQIICAVYGINDSYIKRNLKKVGEELGIAESTVSSHLMKAFKKLVKVFGTDRKQIENIFEQVCDIYQILQKEE